MSVASAAAYANSIGSRAMTDPRPAPRWGEYADVPPLARPVAEQRHPDPEPTPEPARRRRTGDIVITVALLVVGLYDVIVGFSTYANLAPVFVEVYAQQGIGEFASPELALSAGVVANVSRIVILLVTITVSLAFIARGRRAFWVPLAGAALAIIVVIGCFVFVMANDPGFAAYVNTLR